MQDTFLQAIQSDPTTSSWLMGWIVLFLAVVARLGGMFFAIPTLSRGMPLRFRVVLVLMITVAIAPSLQPISSSTLADMGMIDIGISVTREALFGMLIGSIVQLLITGIQVAGELIAITAGLQMAQTADPSTGEQTNEISRLIGVVVTVTLFVAGGHRLLLDGLLTSFHDLPPLSLAFQNSWLDVLIDHLSIGVTAGLRVAAPILGCLLLSNLVVALVSRTIPQLNSLAIGLNLNVMAALVMIALTIGSAGLVFQEELSRSMERLNEKARAAFSMQTSSVHAIEAPSKDIRGDGSL